uniref:Uncharacterized protein n=1 Tax=Schistosoma mansoni TaxID=6183 RepID=A0A3Q0KUV1_SCHMA
MPQKDQVVRQQPGNPSRSGTPTSRGASPYPNRWASRSPRRNDTCCCLCGKRRPNSGRSPGRGR